MNDIVIKICNLKYQYEELLYNELLPAYRKHLTPNNAIWVITNPHELRYVNKNILSEITTICNDFLSMETTNDC
mgnify:CR=1 FL=1